MSPHPLLSLRHQKEQLKKGAGGGDGHEEHEHLVGGDQGPCWLCVRSYEVPRVLARSREDPLPSEPHMLLETPTNLIHIQIHIPSIKNHLQTQNYSGAISPALASATACRPGSRSTPTMCGSTWPIRLEKVFICISICICISNEVIHIPFQESDGHESHLGVYKDVQVKSLSWLICLRQIPKFIDKVS